jgi:SAM-dependent methyltransferase
MTSKSKPTSFKKSQREMQPSVLRQANIRKLPNRLSARGEIVLPAVPSLVDHYVQGLDATWRALGRFFTPTELQYLREVLGTHLKKAYEHSQYSRVSVSYETDPPPKTSLTWTIAVIQSTIHDEYAQWVATRTPPLFGEHPDSRVVDAARALGSPGEVAVVDVGAGTGRNALALAREGFRVDAVELTSSLADIMRQTAENEKLSVGIFQGSIFDESVQLPNDHYQLMFLSEVVSHFRSKTEVRNLFEVASRALRNGGQLLFNSFMPMDGYKPDDLAREMAQTMWCSLFTRHEINEAAAGLFRWVGDESVLAYEKEHHAPDKWPPTGWYEGWTSGQDAFDLTASKCPIEMRWLTFEKTGCVT